MKASITIGGKKLSIVWADIEEFGTYCHDSACIALNSNLKGDAMTAMDTLRHELMHAALAISGVGFGITQEQEEQIVRCMESIFSQHGISSTRMALDGAERPKNGRLRLKQYQHVRGGHDDGRKAENGKHT